MSQNLEQPVDSLFVQLKGKPPVSPLYQQTGLDKKVKLYDLLRE